MGEVYRARDTRLDRTVALKVSREQFGERFRNEALAVAALNHPHVCTLHDVGPDYLVMELVEGKPLKGPLPFDEALRLAGQVADALDHAHRHGVVHRDLKPSNILVSKAGAKVLDFGLAKRLPPNPAAEAEPTLTEQGMVVGTPRYMAPEQIRGQPADARSDVFAFGLVLYELLAGRHAFEGDGAAGVMAAILEREPVPLSRLNPRTPAALAEVVRTCLAKDPDDRWQSVRELKHALGWASRSGTGLLARSLRLWGAAAAGLVALAALGLVLASRRATVEKAPAARFQVAMPAEARLTWYERPAVSPDGTRIAIATVVDDNSRLVLRALNALETTSVPGTEGASSPFWSADGRRIGFVAQGKLKTVDVASGSVQVVCDVPALFGASWDRILIMVRGFRGASWSRGGTIVFSSGGELLRVSSGGGDPTRLGERASGETSRTWPHFLPDGRRYLYLSQATRPEDQGVYVASLDSSDRRRLVASDHDAAYASGHLLFVRGGALLAQPFDPGRLRLSGEPVTLAQPVAVALPPYRGAAYGVSPGGVLAWRAASAAEGALKLTWLDRSGKSLAEVGEVAEYSNPALSPDERQLAVSRRDPRTKTRDIWVLDMAHGRGRRLTFDPADDFGPVFSPDAKWIAFGSERLGKRDLYRKLASGSGEDELLIESKDTKNSEAWSPDGSFLLYNFWPGGRPADLYLLPLSPKGAGPPQPFLASEFREDHGSFAPDGRWLAYRSDDSGRDEVYVKGILPGGKPGPGKWQISTEGGLEPRWRGDGREIFYVSGSTLMAVDVKADGTSFQAERPRPLFEVRLPPNTRRNRFVVSRDGQRFLVLIPTERTGEAIDVLLNWSPPAR
jgi:Tol biopolymer transport system component